jgi:hypothetical protein
MDRACVPAPGTAPRGKSARERRHGLSRDEADECAEHEAADVSPPCDRGRHGARGQLDASLQQLHAEPGESEQEGRQREDQRNEPERHQGENARPWIGHGVGRDHRGDRARGADHRLGRIDVGRDVDDIRGHPAGDIERKEAETSEPALHRRPEDP